MGKVSLPCWCTKTLKRDSALYQTCCVRCTQTYVFLQLRFRAKRSLKYRLALLQINKKQNKLFTYKAVSLSLKFCWWSQMRKTPNGSKQKWFAGWNHCYLLDKHYSSSTENHWTPARENIWIWDECMEIAERGQPHAAAYCRMDNEVLVSPRMATSQPGVF